MAWVKSEYAAEVSVLSAWLAALVPWSVSFYAGPVGSRLFSFRFPLAELQVRAALRINGETALAEEALAQVYPGTHLLGGIWAITPVSAITGFGQVVLSAGGIAWALGALVVLVAVALSLAMVRDEEATAARLPRDNVRIMGGLLAIATVCFGTASVLYFLGRSVVGIPIPVGVLVVGTLAVSLLRVERV